MAGSDEEARKQLVAAIEAGDAVRLRELLTPSDLKPAILQEPLATAASRGDAAAVSLLLERGADPDAGSATLDPALICAVRAGHLPVVRALIAGGANLEVHAGNFLMGLHLTALQEAAARGFKEIVQALLDAGADPEAPDVMGHGQPVFQAGLRGHDDVASLLYRHVTRSRERKSREYLESHGYTILPDRIDKPQFFLSGSQVPIDADAIVRKVCEPAPAVAPQIPFSAYDGWLKQIDQSDLNVVLLEALDALFPIFTRLGLPRPEDLPGLAAAPAPKGEPRPIRLSRERRFAGDHLLPRGRYHTLCTSEGGDDGTLCNELFAYRDVRTSDEIRVLDTSIVADRETLQWPDGGSAAPLICVVMRPGAGGLNGFLHRAGLKQKEWIFKFPVRVTHVRMEKVIDLRQPATQAWFTRFFSQLVDDISEWTRTDQRTLRWWPGRPALERFEQILPSLLTQELGGNTFTKGVGSWLRRAGADALIYPSARTDVSLRVRDGVVAGFRGWNLVDYRGAEQPLRQIYLDVDDHWPDRVRLGAGMDLRTSLPDGLFEGVAIRFVGDGAHAGSFEVENLQAEAMRLYEEEIACLRQRRQFRPWWAR